jgi:hypothetical protein
MKRQLFGGVTAVALMVSAQAAAQSVTVELAPEQRTRIKEYVVKEHVRPYAVQERISVGTTLPADVELHAVPSDWGPRSAAIATCTPMNACISSIPPAGA